MRYWNQVINLMLKFAKQRSFASAYGKRKFREIASGETEYDDYSGLLQFLIKCLYQATGKKTVILLDEYDVPLENAYFKGFYGETISFCDSAENFYHGFLTGILSQSKEEI